MANAVQLPEGTVISVTEQDSLAYPKHKEHKQVILQDDGSLLFYQGLVGQRGGSYTSPYEVEAEDMREIIRQAIQKDRTGKWVMAFPSLGL